MKKFMSLVATAIAVVAVSLAPAMANPGDQKIVNVVHAAPGWTSVVPLDLNGDGLTDFLSYNAATGLAIYSIAIDTKGNQKVVNIVHADSGWTSIVPMRTPTTKFVGFLSYNANTGQAVYSIGTDAQGDQQVVANIRAAKGWTSIVPINLNHDAYTDLLWYNATTGRANFSIATTTPGVQRIAKDYNAAVGWTSIVPMVMPFDYNYPDFLSYNANTGLAIYSIGLDNRGDQQIVNVVHAAKGWTSIVPMLLTYFHGSTDLLSYNATTGRAIFSVADASVPGVQHIVKDYTAAQGWTSIVPVNVNNDGLTDLLSYNATTGLAIYSIGLP